jgi:hypothetical protein
MTNDNSDQPTGSVPLPPETKVFNTQDGEPGTILNRVSPDAYEVMTDEGIEVWLEKDIQVVED